MSAARDEILGRIRGALHDVPRAERPEDVPVAREYRRAADADLGLLAERLRDYHADVRRVAPDRVGAAVTDACARLGLRRVAVPPALRPEWRPLLEGAEVVEDAGLGAHDLDAIDAAVTGCAVAIVETGTLVLDGHGESGRRILTLVPDHHICIVRADQVMALVPQAVAAVAPAVRERRAAITLVSGPSASSDIELTRVEGVHGPRHLLVVIVEGGAAGGGG